VGQVALTRKPILLNDVSTSDIYIAANPEVRSELAVPLIAKNRLIGVMDIESEQANYFRPEHLHLLTLTASRIAQAIENARLYTASRARRRRSSVLNEIAVELTSILDLDRCWSASASSCAASSTTRCSPSCCSTRGANAHHPLRLALRLRHAPSGASPSSGLVGAAVREWRLINVADVRKDPRYLEMNEETRSELIVPLFYKGRVIGVLDLEHTRGRLLQ
jgi:sigma-B regulation protein RsbU (phosphoserine phosphatase)